MKRSGLTLIEMAIVLVILGLILGIGTASVVQFIKWNKRRTSQEVVSSATESLIGYAVTNNYLTDNLTSNFKDAYSQSIISIIASKLTSSFLQPFNATVCDVKNTGLSYYDNSTNATIKNVAFVVFSKGEDYQSDTFCNGTQVNNSQICEGNVTTDTSMDIVRYVTLPELKQRLGCIGSPLKILNNELPYGFENSTYNATVYAKGGIPFTGNMYEWCVEDTGLSKTGVSIDCGGISPVESNCSATTSWKKCKNVELNGTPTSYGTYKLTFYVKDSESNDNQKMFAVTINPPSSGGGGNGGGNCTSYTVYNESGSNLYWNCACSNHCKWNKGHVEYLSTGQSVTIYDSFFWFCLQDGTISYLDATKADANKDCTVYYEGSGTLVDN